MPCLLSRTIFRNLDAGFRTAAEVGGDGDNDSAPVLLAEVGGDSDNDSDLEFFITAAVGDWEYESDTDLFSLSCVGGTGEMLSASERAGDVTGGLLSLCFDDLLDIVFGEDELRTKFLCLAGRRAGDEWLLFRTNGVDALQTKHSGMIIVTRLILNISALISIFPYI